MVDYCVILNVIRSILAGMVVGEHEDNARRLVFVSPMDLFCCKYQACVPFLVS